MKRGMLTRHGAAIDAVRLGALQAALRLEHGELLRSGPGSPRAKLTARSSGSCSGIADPVDRHPLLLGEGWLLLGHEPAFAATMASWSDSARQASRAGQGLLLEGPVGAQPVRERLEVDLVAVELRPVHARVARLAADGDAAAAAHPGPVEHDRVQGDGGGHAVRPGQLARRRASSAPGRPRTPRRSRPPRARP